MRNINNCTTKNVVENIFHTHLNYVKVGGLGDKIGIEAEMVGKNYRETCQHHSADNKASRKERNVFNAWHVRCIKGPRSYATLREEERKTSGKEGKRQRERGSWSSTYLYISSARNYLHYFSLSFRHLSLLILTLLVHLIFSKFSPCSPRVALFW